MKIMGENDPRQVKMLRIFAGDSIAPFSLEEQWQQVANWYALLEHARKEPDSVYSKFNEAWDLVLSEHSIFNKRGKDLSNFGETPLDALRYIIGMSCYPPPELLLAITDCLDTYMADQGRMTLEEAFFGRVRKSAGNHAKRSKSKSRKSMMRSHFLMFLHGGDSRAEAAEKVSALFGAELNPRAFSAC